MIALGIRYLTKYAVATNLARQPAEWPPHPGRVFMAMAASHFESGADAEELTALEWLAMGKGVGLTGAVQQALVALALRRSAVLSTSRTFSASSSAV